jgi:(R)-citramalate synthase
MNPVNKETIEVLDVTLRDGEQTRGVSFNKEEKLNIAKSLLEKVNVNRVEIASARVSKGELDTVIAIMEYAEKQGFVERVEVLGFVDKFATVDWMREGGVKNLNLLTKGSLHHLTHQLKKTLQEHIKDISETVEYAHKHGIRVNVYLEDWSNGIRYSRSYVEDLVKALVPMGVGKIYLADTLGVLSPRETQDCVRFMLNQFPELHFEFHGHNDYDLAVANCLAAVEAGVKGLHVSVNGLGERAGNSPLEAVVTALHDKSDFRTSIVEKEITAISRLVEAFSGKRISENRPVVGEDVFTQTAGVHADGDKKANLYANPILPERFGRKRSYALGKLAGKASISENLKELGMQLSSDLEKKLLQKVIEMGDAGIQVTKEDLPFLIADLSGKPIASDQISIESCVVTSGKGVLPTASLTLSYQGKIHKENGTGDGGYDAFMDALSKVTKKIGLDTPLLIDYQVRIPPGGKTSALVETIITWDSYPETKEDTSFRTIGLDSDQLVASIKATEKMLNRVLKP